MSAESVIEAVDEAVFDAHLPGNDQLGTLCGLQATSYASVLGTATDGRLVLWRYQIRAMCPACKVAMEREGWRL